MARDNIALGKARRIMILAVVAIALIQPIGAIMKSENAVAIGQAIGISPTPWAFTGDRNYENYAMEYYFTLQHGNSSHSFQFDRNISSMMHGPHTRKVFFYNLFSHLPNQQNNFLYWSTFTNLVCNEDTFLNEIIGGDKIDGIRIDARDRHDRRWTIEHDCS